MTRNKQIKIQSVSIEFLSTSNTPFSFKFIAKPKFKLNLCAQYLFKVN